MSEVPDEVVEVPGTGTLPTVKMLCREGFGKRDRRMLAESFRNDIYLPAVPEYHVQPDQTVIDIGAFIGTFSLLMASLMPLGRVFALEPSSSTFKVLEYNIKINGVKNVFTFKLALSDKEGTVELYRDPTIGEWSDTIVKSSDNSETVITNTLTNFMDENEITSCDFLKSNCEGAEYPIFLSTPADVLQRIKVMLILYHNDLSKGRTENDLIKHLNESGFQVRVMHRGKWERNGGWIIAINKSHYSHPFLTLSSAKIKLAIKR